MFSIGWCASSSVIGAKVKPRVDNKVENILKKPVTFAWEIIFG